jgi:hypothetical protein
VSGSIRASRSLWIDGQKRSGIGDGREKSRIGIMDEKA